MVIKKWLGFSSDVHKCACGSFDKMLTKRKILLWLLLVSGAMIIILDVTKRIGIKKAKEIAKKKEFSSPSMFLRKMLQKQH